MVMSFTIIYCDIELEHYLQILVNKHGKLNFEVVFLKTLKHALNRLLHGAIQFFLNFETQITLFEPFYF